MQFSSILVVIHYNPLLPANSERDAVLNVNREQKLHAFTYADFRFYTQVSCSCRQQRPDSAQMHNGNLGNQQIAP